MGTRWKHIRRTFETRLPLVGLDDPKRSTTPSVKRTKTTESVIEQEDERRAVFRTAVGERANVLYSVMETAREILHPPESDDTSMKRSVRYLDRAPSAKYLIELVTCPQSVYVYTDSEWGSQ